MLRGFKININSFLYAGAVILVSTFIVLSFVQVMADTAFKQPLSSASEILRQQGQMFEGREMEAGGSSTVNSTDQQRLSEESGGQDMYNERLERGFMQYG